MAIDNIQPTKTTQLGTNFQSQNCSFQRNDSQYQTRLVSGTEDGVCGALADKIGSAFSCVWGIIKSILQKVFFCCDCTEVLGEKSNLDALTKLKDAFKVLKQEFIDERTKALKTGDNLKTREELTKVWKEMFDSQPEEIREKIIKKDLEGFARHKEGVKDIALWVDQAYADETKRNKSLLFVRDLNPMEANGKKFDPVKDDGLPRLMQENIDDLTQQIEKGETKE